MDELMRNIKQILTMQLFRHFNCSKRECNRQALVYIYGLQYCITIHILKKIQFEYTLLDFVLLEIVAYASIMPETEFFATNNNSWFLYTDMYQAASFLNFSQWNDCTHMPNKSHSMSQLKKETREDIENRWKSNKLFVYGIYTFSNSHWLFS